MKPRESTLRDRLSIYNKTPPETMSWYSRTLFELASFQRTQAGKAELEGNHVLAGELLSKAVFYETRLEELDNVGIRRGSNDEQS